MISSRLSVTASRILPQSSFVSLLIIYHPTFHLLNELSRAKAGIWVGAPKSRNRPVSPCIVEVFQASTSAPCTSVPSFFYSATLLYSIRLGTLGPSLTLAHEAFACTVGWGQQSLSIYSSLQKETSNSHLLLICRIVRICRYSLLNFTAPTFSRFFGVFHMCLGR